MPLMPSPPVKTIPSFSVLPGVHGKTTLVAGRQVAKVVAPLPLKLTLAPFRRKSKLPAPSTSAKPLVMGATILAACAIDETRPIKAKTINADLRTFPP